MTTKSRRKSKKNQFGGDLLNERLENCPINPNDVVTNINSGDECKNYTMKLGLSQVKEPNFDNDNGKVILGEINNCNNLTYNNKKNFCRKPIFTNRCAKTRLGRIGTCNIVAHKSGASESKKDDTDDINKLREKLAEQEAELLECQTRDNEEERLLQEKEDKEDATWDEAYEDNIQKKKDDEALAVEVASARLEAEKENEARKKMLTANDAAIAAALGDEGGGSTAYITHKKKYRKKRTKKSKRTKRTKRNKKLKNLKKHRKTRK